MALALFSAVLAPLHAHADPLYTINFLPDNFYATGINNAGQISGAVTLDGGSVHAAIYAAGLVSDLGSFGGTSSAATAINAGGTVIGNFVTASGDTRSFVYGNGSMQELAGLYANGINGGGDIVGRKIGGGAALYSQGVLTELGYLGTGDISFATAINDAGHVVGASTIDLDFHSRQHPFLYSDGVLHDLGTLDERQFNSAVAINSTGQIAGYSEGTNGGMHAFFYEHGVMTDLGSFGGLNLTVGGMNEHGEIVGTGEPWEGENVPFISRGGALVDLNTLVDPALGWTIIAANSINDYGQILATACRDTVCNAVRLDLASAVPEPEAAWLLLTGLLTLAARRKTKPVPEKCQELLN
jgi:probable HAF family extracellular repeat protein